MDDSVNQSGNAESVNGVKAEGSFGDPLIQSGISESDSLDGASHEGKVEVDGGGVGGSGVVSGGRGPVRARCNKPVVILGASSTGG